MARECGGESCECLRFARKRHHPAMRMCASDWYAENLACQNIGGGCATSNVGGTRCRQRAIRTVGPSQSKLKNRCSLRGETNARGLGSDQCLEVDDVKQRGLQELALEQRPTNAQQRFVRKYVGPFPNHFEIGGGNKKAGIIQKKGIRKFFSVAPLPCSGGPPIVASKRKMNNVIYFIRPTAGDRRFAF